MKPTIALALLAITCMTARARDFYTPTIITNATGGSYTYTNEYSERVGIAEASMAGNLSGGESRIEITSGGAAQRRVLAKSCTSTNSLIFIDGGLGVALEGRRTPGKLFFTWPTTNRVTITIQPRLP